MKAVKLVSRTAIMEAEGGAPVKPHVICIPVPAQGHIKAMLDLAKVLYHRGFYVTFVNTEFNHRRFLRSRGPRCLDGCAGFRFEAIPDGLPPSEADSTQDLNALCEVVSKSLLGPFRDLVTKLNHSEAPPVSCIVSDGLVTVSSIVAEEFGIPITLFFSFSACGVMGYKQFRALRENGLTPLKDESYLTNGYLNTVIDWIPGMKEIRLRDLSSFLRTTDPNEPMFNMHMEATEKASKSSLAVIVHAFNALEGHVLDALSSIFSQIYAIGPLPLMVKEIPKESPLNSIGHSLWREDNECFNWLNSWPLNSVVYVNFGSITVMTSQQLLEFGLGLAHSKHLFLWIIRPDLVIGESSILPREFVEDTKERGMVASWCAQEQVLNHPSVGGFLTHCGWNSTIESISAGVPMLCWPFFADQQTNCRFTCREWEIGMEIDSDAKRDEVEKLVRELMEEDKGKKMRAKAMEWKRLAEEAIGAHGSSSIALNKLVDQLLLSKQHDS